MSCIRRVATLFLATLTSLLVFLHPAAAQWKPNGVPVATYPGNGCDHQVQTPDGNGGVFIAWEEDRLDGNNIDVFVQHIDMNGYPLWAVNGVSVNPNPAGSVSPALVDDGAGGVIVVWSDDRNDAGDIYAQRFNNLGVPQWTSGGVLVCNGTDAQTVPAVVGEGMGGAIIVWEDARFGAGDHDIFANRIDANGNLAFPTSSVSVCGALGIQSFPLIVSDGAGGAIIGWNDDRNNTDDLYAQRIDASNVLAWASNGTPFCQAASIQGLADMVPDGFGGAIMTWVDFRNGNYDVYAQRISSAGTSVWTGDGVPVCVDGAFQLAPQLAADGSGGAVIVWEDYREGPLVGIYAEHIDNIGATSWLANGQAVVTSGNGTPRIANIGDSFVLSWDDGRVFSQVFAQRLTIDGVEMWPSTGIPITSSNWLAGASVITGAGFGGAIVSWLDFRAPQAGIYTQRLEPSHGEWGRPEPTVASANDNPGDQGGYVELNWYASDRDKQPYNSISFYSTWRATDSPFMAAAANGGDLPTSAVVWAAQSAWPEATIVTSPDAIAADFEGRAIWVNEGPSALPEFWEWMSNQTAYYQPGYSYLMPTRADSSGGGPAQHYFKVIAHTSDQYVFWESQYAPGYSVDNLAPGAPLVLVATRVGNYVRLDWNPSGLDEPDFSEYVVYRATSAGVTPVPSFLLDSTGEETLWDQNTPPGTPYYYIVTAKDVHGNQSLPSNEANVDGSATGIGDMPALTALQVMPNAPNPFGAATTLRVGLPRDGDVTLEVYDVAGRRVFVRTYPSVGPGWRDISFDGRDGSGRVLASGVYFYRVQAAGATITRKMVLTR